MEWLQFIFMFLISNKIVYAQEENFLPAISTVELETKVYNEIIVQDTNRGWIFEHVRYFDLMTNKGKEQLKTRLNDMDTSRLFTVVLSAAARLGWFPTKRMGAGVVRGIQRFLTENPNFKQYQFDLLLVNDGCDEYGAAEAFLDLEPITIDAVFSMRCSSSVQGIGYYLTHKDVPVFVNAVMEPMFGDKTVFQTLIRISDSFKYIGKAFNEIFTKFHWTRIGAMAPLSYNQCEKGMDAIQKMFMESDEFLLEEWILIDDEDLQDSVIRNSLENMRERTRIILVCVENVHMIRVMRVAKQLGMLTPEYVFLTLTDRVDDFVKEPWGTRQADYSDDRWQEQKELFKYLKHITFPERSSEEDYQFMQNTWEMSQQEPFGYTEEQMGPVKIGDKALREAIACYDGVYQWLLAVNESLEEGLDPRSGRVIFSQVVNSTFQGESQLVVMDENADYVSKYIIWEYLGGEQFHPSAIVDVDLPSNQRIQYMNGVTGLEWYTEDGNPPPDSPPCGFFNELCPPSTYKRDVALGIGLGSSVIIALTVYLVTLWIKKRKFEEEIQRMLWKVSYDEIQFRTQEHMNSAHGRSLLSMKSVMSAREESTHSRLSTLNKEQIFTKVAIYKGNPVAVKHMKITKPVKITKQQMIGLKHVKDLSHENVNAFIGACIEPTDVYILSQYCAKGSLQDVLENEDIQLDKMFKHSLISDLANGMAFIHASDLQSFGHLKSSTCLIDSRWVLKITKVGLDWLRRPEPSSVKDTQLGFQKLLWTAPELLRMPSPPSNGTAKGDVYSFAIVLQEIMFRSNPYLMENETPEEILKLVKALDGKPFRPCCDRKPEEVDGLLITLMENCWHEDPEQRPNFSQIKKQIRKSNKGRKVNIMDSMVQKLERYANNLEDIVEKRTFELVKEKKKTDELLYRMLPSVVAEKLKDGETVPPELYESATVYFSDIVGFTALSSMSTPIQVVDFLNQLYSCFDDIIATFDVYKVETIGDAYMCVSGIPQKNGNRHSSEIANMALAIREAVSKFTIRHLADRPLMVRIGIHTGSCAAGIVGLTMPRYCLFGDTVNMASRMESSSQAMKIQLSSSTHNALHLIGGYETECRGQIEIKGKGSVSTYWLNGCDKKFKSDETTA